MTETGFRFDISGEDERFVGPAWVARTADWGKHHRRPILLAAIGFHVAVLVAMIAIHGAPLVFGETILLKVRPIDPRDMFRGDFVILNYDIGTLRIEKLEGIPPEFDKNHWPREWLKGRTVYVTLEREPEGNHWHAVKTSINRPDSGRFIRGHVTGSWRGGVRFGIEAYYVQEGRGKELEKARNARRLSAEVALTSWGQASLRRLLIDQ